MTILQIVSTVVIYAWMFTVAYMLYQHAVGAGARLRQTSLMLAEANMKSAQSAHDAAEAALKLAELLEKKHAP
jgi:hypothetical protein